MLFTNASLVDAEDTDESQIYAFDVYFPFVICDGLQPCEEGVLLFGIHWVATDGRHTCGVITPALQRSATQPFFPASTLDSTRVAVLTGERVSSTLRRY